MAYFICSAALLLCIAAVKWLGLHSFDAFGFWGGFWFCVAGTATFIAIGFAVDAREARRHQQAPPPAPPYRRPQAQSEHFDRGA